MAGTRATAPRRSLTIAEIAVASLRLGLAAEFETDLRTLFLELYHLELTDPQIRQLLAVS